MFRNIFPTPSSYDYYVEMGQIAIRDMLSELDKSNLPYLATTPHIAKRLGQRSICEILTNPEKCNGHFNVEGNQIISELVGNYIVENSLLESTPH